MTPSSVVLLKQHYAMRHNFKGFFFFGSECSSCLNHFVYSNLKVF
jgi:hypothetical protein